MQRRITNLRRSDDEVVKEGGLLLDFDEIARLDIKFIPRKCVQYVPVRFRK